MWNILCWSGENALVLLKFLILLVIWNVVYATANVNGVRTISLDMFSWAEVFLPRFAIVNCRLKYFSICFGEDTRVIEGDGKFSTYVGDLILT